MNEEKYKKERIEYIADKISPYTVAGCDEDLAEAIFNLVEEENARLKDKFKDLEEWLEAMVRIYENEYKDVDASEHYKCMLHKLKEN